MNTRSFYVIFSVAICLTLFLLSENFLQTKAQTLPVIQQTPLNIGWIFSIPWDISNTLRAPLGGPLSIVIAGGLACVMMFGLFIAPVYYIFGDPERPYNIHDAKKDLYEILEGRSLSDEGSFSQIVNFLTSTYRANATLIPNETIGFNSTSTNHTFPSFTESAFLFLPEKDEQCKKLLVCHAHGFLGYVPDRFLRLYRFFSKKIPAVSKDYQEAIALGLDDQGNCQMTYECSKNITTIAKETLFYVVPRHEHDNNEI